MDNPPAQEALVPFLGVGRDAEGLPTVVPTITVGMKSSFHAPLFFRSVKEQRAIEQGESITRTPSHPSTTDGGPSPSFARYQEAAHVLPAILRLEQRGAEDGYIGSGFASVEPDGSDVLLRLYLHTTDELPVGQDFPISGLPSDVDATIREASLGVVGRKIGSAEYQLLDAMYDRIVLHCALSGLRTLFVKMRGKDEGLDAGVSRLLQGAPDYGTR